MLQNARESFVCPQCHQDMSNMETLQLHYQTVHEKGFFSFAKQKLKSVQSNFRNSNDPSKPNTQYFSISKRQSVGYVRSYNDDLKNMRKAKNDHILGITKFLLHRVALLTDKNQHIPPNKDTKERRIYEQGIVQWKEDTVVKTCESCLKSFGLTKRKHHCRLDGKVICNQCSQFLSFSTARCLIDPNIFTSPIPQQLINVTNITSSTINSNESSEDYLRICVSCGQYFQRFYNQIRFKDMEKDEIFIQYEKIVQARTEYNQFRPTYTAIVDSLLNGDLIHQITDAQNAYRQLRINYDKIDSTSKLIAKLPDSRPNEYGTGSKDRYAALCRNIRVYSIQLLQNCTISTRRVPSEDDIKQAQHERITRLALTIPGMSCFLTGIPKELEPFILQYYQITQFIQRAKVAGRDDEVRLLEINLKEVERDLNNAIQHV